MTSIVGIGQHVQHRGEIEINPHRPQFVSHGPPDPIGQLGRLGRALARQPPGRRKVGEGRAQPLHPAALMVDRNKRRVGPIQAVQLLA